MRHAASVGPFPITPLVAAPGGGRRGAAHAGHRLDAAGGRGALGAVTDADYGRSGVRARRPPTTPGTASSQLGLVRDRVAGERAVGLHHVGAHPRQRGRVGVHCERGRSPTWSTRWISDASMVNVSPGPYSRTSGGPPSRRRSSRTRPRITWTAPAERSWSWKPVSAVCPSGSARCELLAAVELLVAAVGVDVEAGARARACRRARRPSSESSRAEVSLVVGVASKSSS